MHVEEKLRDGKEPGIEPHHESTSDNKNSLIGMFEAVNQEFYSIIGEQRARKIKEDITNLKRLMDSNLEMNYPVDLISFKHDTKQRLIGSLHQVIDSPDKKEEAVDDRLMDFECKLAYYLNPYDNQEKIIKKLSLPILFHNKYDQELASMISQNTPDKENWMQARAISKKVFKLSFLIVTDNANSCLDPKKAQDIEDKLGNDQTIIYMYLKKMIDNGMDKEKLEVIRQRCDSIEAFRSLDLPSTTIH